MNLPSKYNKTKAFYSTSVRDFGGSVLFFLVVCACYWSAGFAQERSEFKINDYQTWTNSPLSTGTISRATITETRPPTYITNGPFTNIVSVSPHVEVTKVYIESLDTLHSIVTTNWYPISEETPICQEQDCKLVHKKLSKKAGKRVTEKYLLVEYKGKEQQFLIDTIKESSPVATNIDEVVIELHPKFFISEGGTNVIWTPEWWKKATIDLNGITTITPARVW
jgi:hypothetical protein